MAWIFVGVVLVLALVWVYVKQNRPPPTPLSERELPDPQELMASRLTERAQQARLDGQHGVAQAMALKAIWLETRPLLGQDDPPDELDANDEKHLRLAGDIWERYSQLLSDAGQEFAGCMFWPESALPYPREYMERALDLLIEVGEGHIKSIHFRSDAIPTDVVEAMKDARTRLTSFIDVPSNELPTDPEENATYGAERGWIAGDA